LSTRSPGMLPRLLSADAGASMSKRPVTNAIENLLTLLLVINECRINFLVIWKCIGMLPKPIVFVIVCVEPFNHADKNQVTSKLPIWSHNLITLLENGEKGVKFDQWSLTSFEILVVCSNQQDAKVVISLNLVEVKEEAIIVLCLHISSKSIP